MVPPQMELAYSRLLSFDIGRAQSNASDDPQQEEGAPASAAPHGYDVLVSLNLREASPLLCCYTLCAWLGLRSLPGIPAPVLTPAALVASAQVRVICAKNLLGNDWWNGLSDPYVLVMLTPPDCGASIQYK